MTNKYLKKCSIFLAIREMQVKSTLRSLTPVSMLVTTKKKKKQETPNTGEDVWRCEVWGEKEPL
jgi:hypothetical protein